ncbi:MAG: DUF2065 family protein [Gammaproteobacteria bacterium]|nr:DUF2065 family protein [Gammaproteobacteria bacterium]
MGGLDWQDLLSAIALMMVFEGLGPFMAPDGWRRMAQAASKTASKTIRAVGLGLMIVGLALLNLVR